MTYRMSASPPKADMCGATRHVRYGPKADIVRFFRKKIEGPGTVYTRPVNWCTLVKSYERKRAELPISVKSKATTDAFGGQAISVDRDRFPTSFALRRTHKFVDDRDESCSQTAPESC